MNEIYAIDPEALNNFDQLALLANMFGFTEGRFISEFPQNWESKLIQELMKKNPDLLDGPKRLRMIKFIEKFKESSIPTTKASYRFTKNWIENALDNVNSREFNAIICQNETLSPKCIAIEEVLYGEKLVDSRSCKIASDHSKYINLMLPLLIKSTELYLQDVNLKLFDGVNVRYRAKNFIELLFSKIKETERCNKITFILGEENYSFKAMKEKLRDELNFIVEDTKLKNFSLQFLYTNKKESHDRYIFSIKGGMRFGYGFDTPKEAKNDISWVSKSELFNLLNQYNI